MLHWGNGSHEKLEHCQCGENLRRLSVSHDVTFARLLRDGTVAWLDPSLGLPLSGALWRSSLLPGSVASVRSLVGAFRLTKREHLLQLPCLAFQHCYEGPGQFALLLETARRSHGCCL